MNRLSAFAGLSAIAIAIGGYYGWQNQTVVPSGPPDQPRQFAGSGMLKTEAFHLRGGSYRVQWEASPSTSTTGTCVHNVLLESAGSGRSPEAVVINAAVGPKSTGESAAHRVPPGEYYLNIASTCTWQMQLAPQ